jgi:hypothetical protein
VPIVIKSGSLNVLEPSGLVKDCNGIALPLQGCHCFISVQTKNEGWVGYIVRMTQDSQAYRVLQPEGEWRI